MMGSRPFLFVSPGTVPVLPVPIVGTDGATGIGAGSLACAFASA